MSEKTGPKEQLKGCSTFKTVAPTSSETSAIATVLARIAENPETTLDTKAEASRYQRELAAPIMAEDAPRREDTMRRALAFTVRVA